MPSAKMYNPKLIKLAQSLRRRMTPQERHLWYDALKDCEFKFRRQQVIGNYIADFYCAKAKLVVELDGRGHSLPDRESYDFERDLYFESLGIKVLRFKNSAINENFSQICDIIYSELLERAKQ